jgi:hypothetical protein
MFRRPVLKVGHDLVVVADLLEDALVGGGKIGLGL